jgi:hypothetical protein
MIHSHLLLVPLFVLILVGLLGFVGCDWLGLSKPQPPGPTITGSPGDQKVFLTWEPYSSSFFHDYKIMRGQVHGGPYTQIGTAPEGAGTFTDTTAANGTEFFYVVIQNTNDGDSRNSNEVSATPAPATFRQRVEKHETVLGTTIQTDPFVDINAGDLIAVWIWYSDNIINVLSVTDSASNIYQLAVGPTRGAGNLASFQQEIWFAPNINGGTGVAVTAAFSGASAAEKAIVAHEYAGLAPFSPVDLTSAAVGASANASSGVVMETASALVFGAAIFSNTGTAGPGFTQRSLLANNVTEDMRLAAPGPAEATFTNPPQDWIAQMVVFK